MPRRRRRTDGEEVILRRDQFDAATCRELGGVIDEDDKCILLKSVDPKDEDIIILRRAKYQESSHDRRRDE